MTEQNHTAPEKTKHRINVKINDEDYPILEAYAKERGLTMPEIVREAVLSEIERLKKEL